MNKAKIIFFGLLAATALGLLALVIFLNSDPSSNTSTTKGGDVTIWTYGEDPDSFQEIIKAYKKSGSTYSNASFNVEYFDDYDTYKATLLNGFAEGVAPDIFSLPNGQLGEFASKIHLLDSSVNPASAYRKNNLGMFADDLIVANPENPVDEYLTGAVINFDVIGTFYNRRFFKGTDFATWTTLMQSLEDKSKRPGFAGVGAGVGSGVLFADKIFTSLWVQGGGTGLDTLNNGLVQATKTYSDLAELTGPNRYLQLARADEDMTNFDYFYNNRVGAVFAPLSTIKTFGTKNYDFKYVLATQFPAYAGVENRINAWYNVLYINNQSKNKNISEDFLAYVSSPSGQQAIAEAEPYKLPINLQVLEQRLPQKINENYAFVYDDFIDMSDIFVSFDPYAYSEYKDTLTQLLDEPATLSSGLSSLYSEQTCKQSKITEFLALSTPC